MKLLDCSAAALAEAAEALRAGEIVVYPTETVYGLAVDPFSEAALEKLFAAKGRDDGNPILLIVNDPAQLGAVVREVSPPAKTCMNAFWPGPLSLLFPRNPELPNRLTAGGDRICVRCPASGVARGLCHAFGGAVTSTSANPSGETPAVDLTNFDLPGVATGIDGGALPPSAPSTVYDPDAKRVLRAGAVSEEALAAVMERL